MLQACNYGQSLCIKDSSLEGIAAVLRHHVADQLGAACIWPPRATVVECSSRSLGSMPASFMMAEELTTVLDHLHLRRDEELEEP